ncbi:hypothetical protein Ddc_12139 [Ditylenchus destructor]|nr:hypothetical protein Ddc_12139 [Ditylenchus destructor]
MSYYDSEDDSSSEEESSSVSDESYNADESSEYSCELAFKSVADFQFCMFQTYGYAHDANDDAICHEMTQVGWMKGFRLFSRFLKHKTGCDIGKFLSIKHPFDTGYDDTGCLPYAKNGKSRIHIHKIFDYEDAKRSTLVASVNEDLSFRAVIKSDDGFYLVISEDRAPTFKRRMRLSYFHSSWLQITEDCHFAHQIERTWTDDLRTCRKSIPAQFKKKSRPLVYLNCKDQERHQKVSESNRNVHGTQNDLPADKAPVAPKYSTKHKKSSGRKRRRIQKLLPKTINKKVNLKNSINSIRKKLPHKPAKLSKEYYNEVKPAPIGDILVPVH